MLLLLLVLPGGHLMAVLPPCQQQLQLQAHQQAGLLSCL
jgi:hypothetical protein